MNLRCWKTNSTSLQKMFGDKGGDTKLLGILWDEREDMLRIPVKKIANEVQNVDRLSKRVVLSIAAKIFDPIGFIEPFTVRAKIMM